MPRATSAIVVLAVSVACGQQVATPPDASAGSTGVGRVGGSSGPLLDPISMIGTWSFDRTCASDDGMTLAADGTAGTYQGSGMWAVDAQQHLVIIVREQEPGMDVDKLAERLVWRITPTKVVGDDLVGRFEGRRMGEMAQDINARRCPQ